MIAAICGGSTELAEAQVVDLQTETLRPQRTQNAQAPDLPKQPPAVKPGGASPLPEIDVGDRPAPG